MCSATASLPWAGWVMRSDPPIRAHGGAGEGFLRLHPYSLFAEAAGAARTLILPALLGGASMARHHFGRGVTWGLLILAVPALLFAVAEYLSFRYRLSGDRLFLNSGVLSRRRRVVPLARVQNVDLRENVVQRLFGVAELRVETAGGDPDEAITLLLGRAEATALRADLLARRADAEQEAADAGSPAASDGRVLARLSPRDLVLAGLTGNEAGIILALLVGALELVSRLPVALPLSRVDPRIIFPELSRAGTILVSTGLLLALLFVAVLLSITGALVSYAGFTLERRGSELRKRFGLLDRREVTVPLARVQALRIEESWIRRWLGFAALRIETAGVGPGESRRGGAEAFLPLVRTRDIPHVARAVFGDIQVGSLTYRPVHPYARTRARLRYSLPVLILSAAATLWWGEAGWGLLALLLGAYAAGSAHYRHLGYALEPGYVVARSGFLNRVTWIVPTRKVQTLHLLETPWQRRRGIASGVVDTAAGGIRMPDLVRGEVLALFAHVALGARGGADAAEEVVGGGQSEI